MKRRLCCLFPENIRKKWVFVVKFSLIEKLTFITHFFLLFSLTEKPEKICYWDLNKFVFIFFLFRNHIFTIQFLTFSNWSQIEQSSTKYLWLFKNNFFNILLIIFVSFVMKYCRYVI